ncbi:uncharacterized protein [Physcomitrium patens]|uniref:Intracellular pathogenesis-related protein-like protein n=1 Tax=Physcomitrium patens TaxID=3218 RepID=Q9AXI3_PHYPA|nr:uncharacterized protein LOC112278875 [Physcomitrium patens]AAG61085.1 intracellular pathogenesis-related protein-like protein [Physcomitrium patens]PNR60472.1 hypothetical protein PHYPA_003265 [Physcomitrium patens]|eukprot:XP_024368505.1 uncharacterized protein LOC112278875 [Physcomitrella patens]
MAHTLSHTELLNCDAADAWECCKHSDKVLPDLLPEYFSSAEILEGNGGPGTLRVLHFGPAIPQAGAAKERLDKVDEASKTLSYTVVEGDPRYTNFTADVSFKSVGDNQTEATWTAKYDPVGEAGPPEHIKNISILMFKTFEKAIQQKKTVTHTETLNASPDAIWKAVKEENSILPAAMPQVFESISFVQGSGEPGSVRVCKMGPAIPGGGEVVERLDILDDGSKVVGWTVLKGDPRFKHVSAVLKYAPGPSDGTTTATWTATFVPVEENGTLENKFVVGVWKALEAAAAA